MAGAIRGITVEIGGDTTKLGKALESVNKQSRSLQSELKGVNSLLKLDPSNVTLLKQKQDLLTGAIGATKEKLDTLKEAQAQVQAQFERGDITEEQYRDFQREIEATKIKLEGLTDELKNFGSVGAQQIAQVGEKMKDVGSSIEDVGKKFSVISGAAAGVLGGSIMLGSNFTDAMAKVDTIADTSVLSLEDLSAQVLDLSNNTGIASTDIADAVYNAISAGQDTADAVSFVSEATSLARAGFTDVGSSIDILTTILNAYGLEADQVDEVSNRLITTQNLGKTTVGDLASVMGRVIPTAKATGVEIDELCGAYAVMTSNGVNTANTTTYLNSMLNELGKEGTSAAKAFAAGTEHIKEGGLTMAEAMEQGWSLTDVLSILDEQAAESGTSINNMFGSAEAGKAANILWDNADKLNVAVGAMSESAGATETALGKLETPSQKAKVAITQLKNAGTELGQSALTAVAPMIDRLSEGIKNLTSWFSGLSPEMKQTILIILAAVAAVGPLLIVIGKLTTAVGTVLTWAPKLVGGFKAIAAAVGGGTAPFLAIVAVIGTLVAAFVHLWNTNEEFRETITAIWERIRETFSGFVDGIKERLDALGLDFSSVKETISLIWEELCNFFAPIFEEVFNYIAIFFQSVCDAITGILDFFIGIFTGNWEQAWNGIKEFFGAIWDAVVGLLLTVFDSLRRAGSVFLSWFGSSWKTLWSDVKTLFSNVWNGIKTTASNVWNGIKSTATTVWEGVKNAILHPVETARDLIKKAIDAIKGFFNFKVSWPNIPMPHFSIRPSGWQIGDLLKGSIPKLGIDWYAKGGIFDRPTIIPTLSGLKGVGEAGPEAVAPISALQQYVKTAVDNSALVEHIRRLEAILDRYLPTIASKDPRIVLDSGETVGGLIGTIDGALGDRNTKLERGW